MKLAVASSYFGFVHVLVQSLFIEASQTSQWIYVSFPFFGNGVEGCTRPKDGSEDFLKKRSF